jgi:hypothetical protein
MHMPWRSGSILARTPAILLIGAPDCASSAANQACDAYRYQHSCNPVQISTFPGPIANGSGRMQTPLCAYSPVYMGLD